MAVVKPSRFEPNYLVDSAGDNGIANNLGLVRHTGLHTMNQREGRFALGQVIAYILAQGARIGAGIQRVVNQLESRGTLSQLIREALAEIAVPVAKTAVRKRSVYKASALEGRTVFDMGKRGAEAAEELDQLIKEVIRP